MGLGVDPRQDFNDFNIDVKQIDKACKNNYQRLNCAKASFVRAYIDACW